MIISKLLKKKMNWKHIQLILLIMCVSVLYIGYISELKVESIVKNNSDTYIDKNHNPIPQLVGNHDSIMITTAQQLDDFSPKTGAGIESDPYVIKDLIIVSGADSRIEIKNTQQFLIIRNCTLIGAPDNPDSAGINLYNVANVKLINNTLTNNYCGIMLQSSQNITIQNCNSSANVLSTSENFLYSGIYLYSSKNIRIIDNIVHSNNNGFSVIQSTPYSENVTFKGNSIKNSRFVAIRISTVNKSIFTDNIIQENGFYNGNYKTNIYGDHLIDTNFTENTLYDYIGIRLYSSCNIKFQYNNLTFIGNPNTLAALLYLETITFVDIRSNNFTNPAGAGIEGKDIENANITMNNFDRGHYGIYMSKNLTQSIISYNFIKKCSQVGCYLYNSTLNTISYNNFTMNGYATSDFRGGLYLYKSSNNSIVHNNASNNEYAGITLSNYSHNNNLSYNVLLENTRTYGLYIVGNNYNKIDHNRISNAAHGLLISTTTNTSIFENIFENNSHHAIWAGNNQYLVICANQILNNHNDGIFLETCSSVWIELNNFTQNDGNGLQCYSSCTGNILKNNFSDNKQHGMVFVCGGDLRIYLNQFLRNSLDTALVINGHPFYYKIYWNYWDNYVFKYPDATSENGVWNTPYELNNSDTFDYYPLVEPRLAPLSVLPAPQWNISDDIATYEDNIKLNWTTIPNATSYKIYMNNHIVGSFLTNSCLYTFRGWGYFRFYVTAVNGTGQSLPSSLIWVYRYINTTDQFEWEQRWIDIISSSDDLNGPPASVWSDGENIFTVSSTTTFRGNSVPQLLYTKWNAIGAPLWNHTWIGSNAACMGLDLWGDSNFIYISGVAPIPDSTNQSQIVLKINKENGDIIWSNAFETTGDIEMSEIICTDYFVYTIGIIEDYSQEIEVVQLIRWDRETGNILDHHIMNSTEWYAIDIEDLWTDGSGIFLALKIEEEGSILHGYLMKLDPITFDPIWTTIFTQSDNDVIVTIGGFMDKLYVVGKVDHEATYYTLDASTGLALINGTMNDRDLAQMYMNPRQMIVNDDYIILIGESSLLDPYNEETYPYFEYPMIFSFDHDWNPLLNITFGQTGDPPQQIFYGIAVVKNAVFGLIKLHSKLDELNAFSLTLVRYNYTLGYSPPPMPFFVTLDQTIFIGNFTIQWGEVLFASSYRIYINGTFNQTVFGTSVTIWFGIAGIYIIQVTAKNSMGESGLSNQLKITVQVLLEEEGPSNLGWVIGMSTAGTLVGVAAANIFPIDKIRKRRRYRKIFEQGEGESQKKDLISPDSIGPKDVSKSKATKKSSKSKGSKEKISKDIPSPTETSPEAVKKLSPEEIAKMKDYLYRLKLLWDKIPEEMRMALSKVIEKYYKFKDEAAIMVFSSFRTLSGDLFLAYQLLREGKLQDALSKLSAVTEAGTKEKFPGLVQEAKLLQDEFNKTNKITDSSNLQNGGMKP